jgi:hypothetical protein
MSMWSRLQTFRKELTQELTPQRDPPGYVPPTLLRTDVWERMSSQEFRYAMREAWRWHVRDDWGWLGRWFRKALGDTSEEDKAKLAAAEAAKASSSAAADAATTAAAGPDGAKAAEQGPQAELTAEDLRRMALGAAKRLGDASKDAEMRTKLAAMGNEAMKVAGESLDQFLLGYAEGKNEEVKAFIEEQLKKDSEFVARLKKIQANMPQQPQQATQQTMQQQAQQPVESTPAGQSEQLR